MSGDKAIYLLIIVVMNFMVIFLAHAAGVLDPEAHYKYGYGKNPIFAKALKKAIEKIADSPQSEVQALAQFDAFRSCRGEFDSRGAQLASSQMSPCKCLYLSLSTCTMIDIICHCMNVLWCLSQPPGGTCMEDMRRSCKSMQ